MDWGQNANMATDVIQHRQWYGDEPHSAAPCVDYALPQPPPTPPPSAPGTQQASFWSDSSHARPSTPSFQSQWHDTADQQYSWSAAHHAGHGGNTLDGNAAVHPQQSASVVDGLDGQLYGDGDDFIDEEFITNLFEDLHAPPGSQPMHGNPNININVATGHGPMHAHPSPNNHAAMTGRIVSNQYNRSQGGYQAWSGSGPAAPAYHHNANHERAQFDHHYQHYQPLPSSQPPPPQQQSHDMSGGHVASSPYEFANGNTTSHAPYYEQQQQPQQWQPQSQSYYQPEQYDQYYNYNQQPQYDQYQQPYAPTGYYEQSHAPMQAQPLQPQNANTTNNHSYYESSHPPPMQSPQMQQCPPSMVPDQRHAVNRNESAPVTTAPGAQPQPAAALQSQAVVVVGAYAQSTQQSVAPVAFQSPQLPPSQPQPGPPQAVHNSAQTKPRPIRPQKPQPRPLRIKEAHTQSQSHQTNQAKQHEQSSHESQAQTQLNEITEKQAPQPVVAVVEDSQKTKSSESAIVIDAARSQQQEQQLSSKKMAWKAKVKREKGTQVCPEKGCHVHLASNENMQRHRECHRTDGPGFVCVECPFTVGNWPGMAGHLWRKHS